MAKTLFSLTEQIRKCTSCSLWKTRTLAVPGEGPSQAKIMFVGEAPGAEEDRQGLPFVGRSGKFLDEMLILAGIGRKDVFITGAVKCHPPRNRTPAAGEVETCRELWLKEQIKIIKPELIVVLGKIALKSLLGGGKISEASEAKMNGLHGKIVEKDGQKYFITFHPSAGMRFPKIKRKMIADFRRLKEAKKSK
ncbi:MAG: uracil-DNA glycosylase [Nanoarchaeota archaeon]